ncbi:E3 ubiquitin-protein ligase BRE1-like [Dendronephthya gigantea]|uniref:E3 ubiquitin-protein ligase BRE1-like n=1 Tax=Dendronephthya gigantea TaxID=151771 RepID=UPI001068E065|nr:E3 ubiquitin-protein ligase BRE1-like [Dendronephthya gigantea]XP_028409846.1 E3 ubiquitin-protein ligase BRE1-like [Dendronephthya gigantea]XP_028409848.1 E3 ubiquitin-protein ligase BRE1-like [Dendronephthya gigantea]XP_028409849.1 E3 ubiquitin-protein ligase BRE1-like [Dendronephthya gigantea]
MTEESELLLTDYLLNFDEDEESAFKTECLSSGVDCSEDEEECSLSLLKENLKNSPKKSPSKQITPKHCGNKKRQQTLEKKERDRMRSVAYRKKRTEQFNASKEECKELRESNQSLNGKVELLIEKNKSLTEKNESLTEKNEILAEKNEILAEKNVKLDENVSSLQKQIEYLEKVISNQSALSAVLGAIKKHSGLTFNNHALQVNSLKRKRVENDSDENGQQVRQLNGGVCVHLTSGRMSLEFCRECDMNAADK